MLLWIMKENKTSKMADPESFDADDYLETRYGDVTAKDRVQFLLSCFHEAFQSLPYSLKVLDYGSGPVIQHCISAAAHASEIVFSDIAESNREAVRKWLRRDPTAFNWSPHFDYVVQTLEGKGEKEAREREEMLRKVVKDVVHCDIFAKPPIQEGFEGAYDVLIEGGCLVSVCTSIKSLKESLVALSHLLKEDGTLLMWGPEYTSMEQNTTVYRVGNKEYECLCAEKEVVVDAVKEAGFSIVRMKGCEVDRSYPRKHVTEQPGWRGLYFIHAKRSLPSTIPMPDSEVDNH